MANLYAESEVIRLPHGESNVRTMFVLDGKLTCVTGTGLMYQRNGSEWKVLSYHNDTPPQIAVAFGSEVYTFSPVDQNIHRIVSQAFFSPLPSLPAAETAPGKLALTPDERPVLVGSQTNKVYTLSADGNWEELDYLAATNVLQGIGVNAAGDIVAVDSNSEVLLTNLAGALTWTSVALPTGEQAPGGLSLRQNGNPVIAGNTNKRVYLRNLATSAWSVATDYPISENLATDIIAETNDYYVMAGATNDKLWIRSNNAWDTGADYPTGESDVKAITQDINGEILIAGNDTKKIYSIPRTGTGRVFVAVLDYPTGETDITGMAVAPNGGGNVFVAGNDTNMVYRFPGAQR